MNLFSMIYRRWSVSLLTFCYYTLYIHIRIQRFYFFGVQFKKGCVQCMFAFFFCGKNVWLQQLSCAYTLVALQAQNIRITHKHCFCVHYTTIYKRICLLMLLYRSRVQHHFSGNVCYCQKHPQFICLYTVQCQHFLNVPRGIAHKSYVYKSCDRYTLNVLVAWWFGLISLGSYDVLATFLCARGGLCSFAYLLFAIFVLIQTLFLLNVQNMFALIKLIEIH